MSRKLILFLAIATLSAACGKNTVEISGILENSISGEYIFLDELKSNELLTVDSVMLTVDGSFDFKRKIKSPSFYLLKINQNNFLTMLLEPGQKIKMTSDFDSLNYPIVVSGSNGTRLMADYNKKLRKTITSLSSLSDIHGRYLGTPELPRVIDSLDNLANGYLNEISSYTKKYIDDNLSSLVSLVALYQQVAPNVYVLHPEKDLPYFVKVDSSLFSQYPEYEPVKSLHGQLQEFTANTGSQNQASATPENTNSVPEIALPSPKGDTIRLSSTKGSVVLLDFWASWCAPCRIENPNLVKAYEMYHSRGFQIYQVSLDKTKEVWIKGIEDDNLNKWIHVSDVGYWNSVVVPLYKIESIPANYLLDKEGRVIATNLRGESLQKKLAELFN
ncbi:MAG: TlpA disulfide reductase family protein [Bacteroidales bacterium]